MFDQEDSTRFVLWACGAGGSMVLGMGRGVCDRTSEQATAMLGNKITQCTGYKFELINRYFTMWGDGR